MPLQYCISSFEGTGTYVFMKIYKVEAPGLLFLVFSLLVFTPADIIVHKFQNFIHHYLQLTEEKYFRHELSFLTDSISSDPHALTTKICQARWKFLVDAPLSLLFFTRADTIFHKFLKPHSALSEQKIFVTNFPVSFFNALTHTPPLLNPSSRFPPL